MKRCPVYDELYDYSNDFDKQNFEVDISHSRDGGKLESFMQQLNTRKMRKEIIIGLLVCFAVGCGKVPYGSGKSFSGDKNIERKGGEKNG